MLGLGLRVHIRFSETNETRFRHAEVEVVFAVWREEYGSEPSSLAFRV